jgi:beta-lactamase class A
MRISRRTFVAGSLATGLIAGGCSQSLPKVTPPELGPGNRFEAALRQIEGEANGTLGAEFFDISTGRSAGINRDMRFGHCSSFKLSLAALILLRDANGEDSADQTLVWGKDDLVFYSPFTEGRTGQPTTLRALAEATQKTSDNTAANLLLRHIGGPQALTQFWRSIGDGESRLDRYELELNDVPPGEVRDTTTPAAMARTVAKLAFGQVLPEPERETLRQWMVHTSTGLRRVRAGLPDDWRAGDKTGTGLMVNTSGIYVDVGFVEPPQGAPLTFATYFRPAGDDNTFDRAHEQPLAQVGELLKEFAEGI